MSIVEGAALSESSRDSKIAEKTFVRFERAHLFADKWTAEALKKCHQPDTAGEGDRVWRRCSLIRPSHRAVGHQCKVDAAYDKARVIGVRGMIPAHFSKLNGGM